MILVILYQELRYTVQSLSRLYGVLEIQYRFMCTLTYIPIPNYCRPCAQYHSVPKKSAI
jgi:hypothetical protein